MNRIYRVIRNSSTGQCAVASELSSTHGKCNRLSRAVASTLFLAAPMLGAAAAAGAAPMAELTGSNGVLWYGGGCDTITVPSTCANETRNAQADASGPALAFPNHLLVGANLSNSNSGPAVSGNLSITGGGTANASRLYVGYENNTTGTVTVSGEGSRWNGGGTLSVGTYGSGVMTLSDGGYARGTNIYVGNFEGGSGDLQVTGISVGGKRSTLETNNTLFVGNNNDFLPNQPDVLPAGDGVAAVSDGGLISSGDGSIGGRRGTGTVTVQGINANGQASQWNMSGGLMVGVDGKGTLNVLDGGEVNNTSAYVGYYGDGDGTVNVGNGGMWSSSAALNVGFLADGAVNVGAGGTVHSNSGFLGYANGYGVVNVSGPGALWRNDGALTAGQYSGSAGLVTIDDGGQVSTGDSVLGSESGAYGSVSVSGAGSRFDTAGLTIGNSGRGVLQIDNGAAVTSGRTVVGGDTTGVGTVTVGGAGSTWDNIDTLFVGGRGTGSATVSNGGTVNVKGKLFVAGTGSLADVPNMTPTTSELVVSGAGSSVNVDMEASIGQLGSGSLQVADGGSFTTKKWVLIGNNVSSDGSVTVTGHDSRMTSTDLSVGHNGKGTLDILDGGTVTSSFGAGIGNFAGAEGSVTVRGAGSRWINAGDLSLGAGAEAEGTLIVDAGGQVAAGGNVNVGGKSSGANGFHGTADGTGTISVSGTGSTLDATGSITVGDKGAGILNVLDEGLVRGSALQLAFGAGSTGVVNIGDGGLAGTLDTASVTGGDGTATVNFDHIDDIDFAPVLGGKLDMNKANSGTTTLAAVNDYAGTTSVQAGTLKAGIAGAFSAASDHTVGNGARLALNGFDQSLASLHNSGMVAFHEADSTAGTTLMIAGDYVGNDGTLLMNTVLGADNSVTDKLVVEGSTRGNSFVQVRNVGGVGAATDNGIELIHVGGASDGVFELQGRAVAGLYDYQLHQGGKNTPDDGNWYLRSEVLPTPPVDPIDPPVDPVDPVTPPVDPVDPVTPPVDPIDPPVDPVDPVTPPVDPVDPVTPPVDPIDPVTPPVVPEQPDVPTPVLRPEPAAYLGNQVAALRMFQNSMHDRVGEPGIGSAENGKGYTTWSRVQSHRLDAGTVGGQIDIDTTANVAQMGVEKQFSVGEGRIHAGVMGGYGRATNEGSSTVTGHQARGEVKGRNVGVYGTWFQNAEGPEGLYVDGSAQYGSFRNTVKGDYLGTEQYDSRVRTASVEAGYSFKMHEGKSTGVYVEPQAQVIHSDYSSDDVREQNGTLVQSRNAGGTTTRLGARIYTRPLNSEHNRVQPFVTANWWSGGNEATIAMDGEQLSRDLPKDIYEVKAGAQLELGKGWSGWGQLGYQTGSGGFRDVGAQMGVKLSW